MFNLIGWIVCGAIFGVWQYRRRVASTNSTVGAVVPTRGQQAIHMAIACIGGAAMGGAVWGSLWLLNSIGR